MKNIFLRAVTLTLVLAAVISAAAFLILPLPGQIPVLMYHFIGDEQEVRRSKNYVSTEAFENQMKFLKTFGFRVLTIEEYDATLQGKRQPKGRELLITFDDGNYSFSDEAYPILSQLNIPATVFIVSGKITGHIDGSMTEEQIKKILPSDIVTFAGHSKTHPFLSQIVDDQVLREEVLGSKTDLENRFGIPIDYFAYPYGDYDERVKAITKQAGYKLGFTTTYKKLIDRQRGPYAIPRIKITRSAHNPLVYWFKITGLYDFFKEMRYHATR